MKIQTAIQYKYKSTVKSAFIFFSILTLLLLFMVIWFRSLKGDNSTMYFSGYGFAATIMMFVVGICSIREDLRLYIQNGIARKTTFVVEILMALFSAALISAGGEIFMLMGNAVSRSVERFFVNDFYQFIYADKAFSLSFVQHMESMGVAASFMLTAFAGGMFFSLMFYRLNKAWSIVAAISIPFLLLGLLPNVLYKYYEQTSAMIAFIAASPWNLVLVLSGISCITLVVDWLLIKNIHIRGL